MVRGLSTPFAVSGAALGAATEQPDACGMNRNKLPTDNHRIAFLMVFAAVWCRGILPMAAQNVGVGEALPQAKLHVAGSVRVDGDSITGDLDKPATILHLLANGGVSIKLDANDDGNERFTVKRSGPDLGSVVFEATEAGNVTASGFGEFNGHGLFDGNLTLDGDSRDLVVGENFDVVGEGSIEFLIDTDNDNASADFGVRNGAGDWMLLVEEDRALTAYPYGSASGETGAIRLRELASGGSSWVGLRAPDGLGGNVWLTLPTTDGSAGQFLQTDGSGVLSWADPPALAPLRVTEADTAVPPSVLRLRAGRKRYVWRTNDSSSFRLPPAAYCYLEGVERVDAAMPAAGGCVLRVPEESGDPWGLVGYCRAGCRVQRCAVACRD